MANQDSIDAVGVTMLPPFRDQDECLGTELPDGISEITVGELVDGDVVFYHIAGWAHNPEDRKIYRKCIYMGTSDDPLRCRQFRFRVPGGESTQSVHIRDDRTIKVLR